MHPTWRLFAHLAVEIPLLAMYALVIVTCLCNSSAMMDSTFYSFIAFIGVLDILTYIVTLFTFRLALYTPFNDFFGGFDDSNMTMMTFIYAVTWTLCAAREFGTLGLALNRLTAVLYNNKKWSMRSFLLTVIISLIGGYACNYYMWDTEAEYMKVDLENGTKFYFMALDRYERDWLNEMAVTFSWSAFAYVLSMGTYVLIAFHSLFGGAHPDVEGKEFRLTKIAFGFQFCNTLFFYFNLEGYRLDRDDFLVAMAALKQGAPIIPFEHDLRSLCVPLFLILFDSAIRARIFSPCGKEIEKQGDDNA